MNEDYNSTIKKIITQYALILTTDGLVTKDELMEMLLLDTIVLDICEESGFELDTIANEILKNTIKKLKRRRGYKEELVNAIKVLSHQIMDSNSEEYISIFRLNMQFNIPAVTLTRWINKENMPCELIFSKNKFIKGVKITEFLAWARNKIKE